MDGKRDILHCISKGSVSMKEFCYTIKNAVGVHARPAGALARMAEKYDSTITIQKDGKAACCHEAEHPVSGNRKSHH